MLNIPETGVSTAVDSGGPLPSPITSISRRDTEVALRYSHMVAEDNSQTLCGLLAAYQAEGGEVEIPIGCDCGAEDCALKPTCPVCKSIATGVVN